MDGERTPLVVIGGGNMGWAVVRAALDERAGRGQTVVVAEPDTTKRAEIAARFAGVEVFATAAEGVRTAGSGARLVVAVKPQIFPHVASELATSGVLGERLVISIMAGVRARTVFERLSGGNDRARIRVVRAMPNLAMAYGKGITALCDGPNATSEDREFAADLFGRGGTVVRIAEELLDAFTALSSSGLAYVFYLAEAMERAAIEVGFDAEQAREIVRQTIAGAAAIPQSGGAVRGDDPLGVSGLSPGQLRARVASRGGTTEAAVRVLDEAGVADAIARAIVAGRDRGRELAG